MKSNIYLFSVLTTLIILLFAITNNAVPWNYTTIQQVSSPSTPPGVGVLGMWSVWDFCDGLTPRSSCYTIRTDGTLNIDNNVYTVFTMLDVNGNIVKDDNMTAKFNAMRAFVGIVLVLSFIAFVVSLLGFIHETLGSTPAKITCWLLFFNWIFGMTAMGLYLSITWIVRNSIYLYSDGSGFCCGMNSWFLSLLTAGIIWYNLDDENSESQDHSAKSFGKSFILFMQLLCAAFFITTIVTSWQYFPNPTPSSTGSNVSLDFSSTGILSIGLWQVCSTQECASYNTQDCSVQLQTTTQGATSSYNFFRTPIFGIVTNQIVSFPNRCNYFLFIRPAMIICFSLAIIMILFAYLARHHPCFKGISSICNLFGGLIQTSFSITSVVFFGIISSDWESFALNTGVAYSEIVIRLYYSGAFYCVCGMATASLSFIIALLIFCCTENDWSMNTCKNCNSACCKGCKEPCKEMGTVADGTVIITMRGTDNTTCASPPLN